VALPEASLTPLQARLTLARPYLLDAHQGRRQQAVSIDPGLAAHFRNDGNQVLEAHRFLAVIAVLYLDRPGGLRRGVVAFTPPTTHSTSSASPPTLLTRAPVGNARTSLASTILSTASCAVSRRRVDRSVARPGAVSSPPPSGMARATRYTSSSRCPATSSSS